MNTRMKKQLSIIIAMAIFLILVMIAAIILMPGGKKTIIKKPAGETTTPVSKDEDTAQYDFIGRIFDANKKPIANTKFGITCGPTDFTTDENGYFRLNGLPVGVYELYAYDAEGKKIALTAIQLSNDGCISLGYNFYDKGSTVNMIFDGTTFIAYNPPKTVTITTTTTPPKPEETVVEDDTYTNFSWMKNVGGEFGAYGMNLTFGTDFFFDVVADPQYSYLNTFIVEPSNFEFAKIEAEHLTKYNKKFFINTKSLITLGSSDRNKNLRGDWRDKLDYAANIMAGIGGELFQGFYYDEVDLYLNSIDFTRVTQYIRETFGLRNFAIHRCAMWTIPYGKGFLGSTYVPTKDEFVITKENHKYVTDVGFWWYGGYEFYGYNAEKHGKNWKDLMSMLDPNTKKWIVPPMGTYDFRHSEEACMEVDYALYREMSAIEGFGGLMFYTMGKPTLWGGLGTISATDPRLTENDFLKDENGEYILDANGNKIVDVKINHSYPAYFGHNNNSAEGMGHFFIMDPLEDGSYRWPRARQYFEIIGKGITSGESRESILSKLDKVFKPDYSKYKK